MSEGLLFNGQFTFLDWSFDPQSGVLNCHYLDHEFGEFVESFVFSGFSDARYNSIQESMDVAFDCLFWMAGVSYYKTSLAKSIIFKNKQPNTEQAAWLKQTWQAGLAELAFENGLGWLDHIEIKGNERTKNIATMDLKPRSLVAIGGGKDSLVSIESIKQMNEEATLFMVGQNKFIQSVAEKTGLNLLSVSRQVDSRLKSANENGAFNGHIPITAINACVAVVAALLFDYDAVVFSNERSADVGNVKAENGQWINHQYSKSLAYEQSWQNIINNDISDSLHCFSLLRPFSELAIIQKFAFLKQYFPFFSSCNRNFHLTGSQNGDKHWCGQCPKCAFVFLCLAPFISQDELLGIFQKNLFNDLSLEPLFESLLGIEGLKPFECVGEQQECRLAVNLLSDHSDWRAHPKVKHWLSILPQLQVGEKDQLIKASIHHMIPLKRNFQKVLKDAS